jgi:PAS domain S-box-containing protein
MPSESVTREIPWFLQGGGEAGALLRAIDWQSHPLGPPQAWPSIVQATAAIMLGSRQAMFMSWGPQHRTIYNDRYAELCGKRHSAAMGEPLAVIWYDIWDVIGDLVRRVYDGESIHMDDIEFVLYRNGYPEEAHFSFSYNPLRSETGEVLGVFCACAETTKEVFLKRELEHERALLSHLFQQSPSFIAKLSGPDHVFEFTNPAYDQLVGNRDLVGKAAREAVPEAAGQGFFEMLDNVLATGKPLRIDSAAITLHRTEGAPPEERFLDFVYQPVWNASGVVDGIFVEGVDVTDRIHAMEALRTGEQFLRSVLQATPDCVKVLDLEGRLEYVGDAGRLMMEIPADQDVTGTTWDDLWASVEKPKAAKAFRLAAKGEASAFQAFALTFAGNQRYWDVRLRPLFDAAGQPERILAVSRDITYLKQIEEEREHLMHELAHRLKNAFSMVQSVINQTLRKAPSVEAARTILAGRVRALSDAQNILTKSITDKMEIREVVDAALAPHRSGEGRFVIDGPVADINGKQGLGLSLALHELATNATKYGALSDSTGQVQITWSVDPGGAFSFNWLEKDGPPVHTPQTSGFGTVLIENIVATYFDGTASLQFLPEGVVFQLTGRITAPEDIDTPDPY